MCPRTQEGNHKPMVDAVCYHDLLMILSWDSRATEADQFLPGPGKWEQERLDGAELERRDYSDSEGCDCHVLCVP